MEKSGWGRYPTLSQGGTLNTIKLAAQAFQPVQKIAPWSFNEGENSEKQLKKQREKSAKKCLYYVIFLIKSKI